jgi:hypothetical protein
MYLLLTYVAQSPVSLVQLIEYFIIYIGDRSSNYDHPTYPF